MKETFCLDWLYFDPFNVAGIIPPFGSSFVRLALFTSTTFGGNVQSTNKCMQKGLTEPKITTENLHAFTYACQTKEKNRIKWTRTRRTKIKRRKNGIRNEIGPRQMHFWSRKNADEGRLFWLVRCWIYAEKLCLKRTLTPDRSCRVKNAWFACKRKVCKRFMVCVCAGCWQSRSAILSVHSVGCVLFFRCFLFGYCCGCVIRWPDAIVIVAIFVVVNVTKIHWQPRYTRSLTHTAKIETKWTHQQESSKRTPEWKKKRQAEEYCR